MDKEELLLKITSYINGLESEIITQKEFTNFINMEYKNSKEKRKPSLYNLFIKEQMEIINQEDPNKKDKMKYIIKLWNDKKPLVKTPRKTLS